LRLQKFVLKLTNRIGLFFLGGFLLYSLILCGGFGHTSFSKINKIKKQIAQKELCNQGQGQELGNFDFEGVEDEEQSIEADLVIEIELENSLPIFTIAACNLSGLSQKELPSSYVGDHNMPVFYDFPSIPPEQI
jgi:hypothetical protein